MLDEERRELDMYHRALACLAAKFTDLPAGSEAVTAAVGLRTDVAAIEAHSSSQAQHDSQAKEGTTQRGTTRQAIREFMNRFAKTAHNIARKKSGFDQNYPMPYGKNDEELLAAARNVVHALDTDRADFARLGISDDYLDAAENKVAAFSAWLGTTNAALGSRAAAVSSRETAFDSAEENFETVDTFIKNHYADEPHKLAAWKIASHVERPPRAKKDKPDA